MLYEMETERADDKYAQYHCDEYAALLMNGCDFLVAFIIFLHVAQMNLLHNQYILFRIH